MTNSEWALNRRIRELEAEHKRQIELRNKYAEKAEKAEAALAAHHAIDPPVVDCDICKRAAGRESIANVPIMCDGCGKRLDSLDEGLVVPGLGGKPLGLACRVCAETQEGGT